MRSKKKESEGGVEEENKGEKEDDEEEGNEEEETRPLEHSQKSLKKGEVSFITFLYLGCIYETKHVWVTNILEEY